MSTETELKEWRYGQAQAERMCADLLALLQFIDIDPQAPLGGGDGKKDILCSKLGIKYVAAVYFPTTSKSFVEIKAKFSDDLEGVKKNARSGFLFFTNQHLTLGNRNELLTVATAHTRDCQIYNLERLRTLLDQPTGYGIRTQYLRIPLSPEEQFAYFANDRERVDMRLEQQHRFLGAMNAKLDKILDSQEFVVRTMAVVSGNFEIDVPPPTRPDLFLSGVYKAPQDTEPFSSKIAVASLLALHRAICFDMPQEGVGCLRHVNVYLAAEGNPLSKAVSVPPEHKDVLPQLEKLLCGWSSDYASLAAKSANEKVVAIASFHAKFLNIHPFVDGNGRVARFILMQQCLDLLGVADMGVFDKGADYYAALQNADKNDLNFLIKLIKPVVGLDD